jgi:hypothetical protein
MQTSDLIAFIAILVAVLAAIYARRSADAADRSVVEAQRTADETRRANRIAFHEGRIGVLKGLQALRGQLLPYGGAMKPEVLWAFHDHVVLEEFYFSETIHAAMEALEKELLELQDTHQRSGGEAVGKLFTHCLQSVKTIEESMRAELRQVARELTT